MENEKLVTVMETSYAEPNIANPNIANPIDNSKRWIVTAVDSCTTTTINRLRYGITNSFEIIVASLEITNKVIIM